MTRTYLAAICLAVIACCLWSCGQRGQPPPAAEVPAPGRTQGRSMVVTRDGVVAAESPLAAQAGATMLARGGNAVDAAVTANAVMGVVEPMMNGIGGDLMVLVYDAKTRRLYGLNASGWSPAGLTLPYLKAKNATAMPKTGIDSVTVPGVVDGWSKLLSRFGRKQFKEALAAAIHFASDGFPVPEWTAATWQGDQSLEDNAGRTFLPNGHAPTVGERFTNPDLARSLRSIAEGGRDAFYQGDLARRIVACPERHQGVLSAQDLATYSSEWVEPLSTPYRDWTVYEMPPNTQGIAALIMLNLMERFPMQRFGYHTADQLHVMIEAKKLAYTDMFRYVADPKFKPASLSNLLTSDYARTRAKAIDLAKASCDTVAGEPSVSGRDTTYLCVADREGNMVSLIQSNFARFGSGVVADGTGFVLQNRAGSFSLNPRAANCVAGHKRPLSTIIPGFMTRGETRIAFGIMGAFNQAQAHAQFVSNVVDFGMNIQAALEAPRFTKQKASGCDVEMEDGIPAAVRAALSARGHVITVLGGYSQQVGGGQAVARDFSTATNFAASDPRKDGEAVPEPAPSL